MQWLLLSLKRWFVATTYIIYQSVWSPTAGERRKEPGNIQDPFSVADLLWKEETFEFAASIEENGIRGSGVASNSL